MAAGVGLSKKGTKAASPRRSLESRWGQIHRKEFIGQRMVIKGSNMAERETNVNQFAGVNALAKRIEELTKQRDELTKERQDSQTRLLEEHGVALASLEKSVALLVDRTKDLGEMSKRITRLESWKVYLAGIASAFTFIGTLIGGGLTLVFRR